MPGVVGWGVGTGWDEYGPTGKTNQFPLNTTEVYACWRIEYLNTPYANTGGVSTIEFYYYGNVWGYWPGDPDKWNFHSAADFEVLPGWDFFYHWARLPVPSTAINWRVIFRYSSGDTSITKSTDFKVGYLPDPPQPPCQTGAPIGVSGTYKTSGTIGTSGTD